MSEIIPNSDETKLGRFCGPRKWLNPVLAFGGLVAVSVLLFVQECNKDARTILKERNNLEIIDSTQTKIIKVIDDSAVFNFEE